MKRTILILTAVVMYVAAIWCLLVFLPFADTPPWLMSLFAKHWQSTLAWMKIRHTFTVVLVGGILASLLVRYDKQTAQVDGLMIGVLSILWGVVFRWTIIGAVSWTWVEITDYLLIGAVIPVLVALINRTLTMMNNHGTGH